MKKIYSFAIFFLFITAQLFAQDAKMLKGQVVDEDTGEPIPGVNVVVKNSNPKVGAATDIDGNYEIKYQEGFETLIFTFTGYNRIEVPADPNAALSVKLKEDAVSLDQVVISASKKEEKILNAPASVSIITAERIQNQTSMTAIDNMKKTPGVDIMTTGLVSANVNLRGFNGIFSGSMLTMVDNRIGRVPSLRVNAFQLIPGNNYDIDKIEVVRGPGSALYGPNAADGVMHIITKSPLDIDGKHETNLSMTTGFRSVLIDPQAGDDFEKGDLRLALKPEFRTAIKLSDKVGFKLSGRYLTGHDWENYDDREPVVGQPMYFGTVRDGNVWERDFNRPVEFFKRDFLIQNYNGDARLDIRPTEDTEIILAGGMSSTKNLELTGLGASQSIGWKYGYGQARFRFKNLFVQYFANLSNAGSDTYLIPQGANPDDTLQMQLLVDKSKLHVVQLQHNVEPTTKLKLIYGLDALFTRPETEGTINGRFENEDNINQYGGYLQGEYQFNDKFKVVAAGRVDYHDVIEEVQVSPRAALVYKPNEQHTLRATYNRAFSTPSSLSLSLDLANGIHPLWNGFQNPFNPQGILMNIRGIGNPVGYNYGVDAESGQYLYTNFWDGQKYPVQGSSNNHTYFSNIIGVISAGLQAEAPEDVAPLVPGIVDAIFRGIIGEDGTINDADLAAIDFVEFLETGDHVGSLWDETGSLDGLTDLESTKSETVETWELGYKGIVKGKFFLQVDGYYTLKKNLRSGLLTKSPFIVFDPNDLNEILGPNEEGGTLKDNLAPFDGLIAPLFENNPAYLVEANGSAYDELVKIIQDANSQLGLGLVTPEGDKVNNDMILTYVNLGNVSIWGMDVAANYILNKDIQLQMAYSFVNQDEIELTTGGTIALNAPKNKVSLGYDHRVKNSGFGYGLNFRWYQGFPAASAVYIGEVDSYSLVDAQVFYRPRSLDNFQVTLDVNNVLGNKYVNFPGTPQIGRMAFLKLAYTIK